MANWPPWWWGGSRREPTPRPEVTPEQWGLLEDERRERERQQRLARAAQARRAAAAQERRVLGQRGVTELRHRNVQRELEMVLVRRNAQAQRLVRQQAQELRQQQRIPHATQVVTYITAALFLLSAIRGASGSTAPDRGDEFRRLSVRLRGNISGTLGSARPTAWSGAPGGAAYHYDDRITEQQARTETIADADHQLASIVATQANCVAQGCQVLDAVLLLLLIGLAVAEALDAKWKALAAVDPAAALALAEVLVMFGTSLIVGAVTETIWVLYTLLAAGQQTQTDLGAVIVKYNRVAGDVAEQISAG